MARAICSIEQNEGALSNVLAKEIPYFEQHPEIWEEVVSAVRQAFIDSGIQNQELLRQYHPNRPTES